MTFVANKDYVKANGVGNKLPKTIRVSFSILANTPQQLLAQSLPYWEYPKEKNKFSKEKDLQKQN